ncbi:MAG: GTP cyclohydrolase 1 [Hyphobacterium sp.]|nr:MAG: GTP cyclohydrolase 1 [Hyphobacterium sp.]
MDDAGSFLPLEVKPGREAALKAVRTLIAWAGDDPDRAGLKDTPDRVIRAYAEWFGGYAENPASSLSKTFENEGGYGEMVLVRDIDVTSHCEHHFAPIIGKASVAYIPSDRVLGLSKLARTVEIFARRLQTQERLTAQIASAIEESLAPKGVAVQIDAVHHCMMTRGVKHAGTSTLTQHFAGSFKTDADLRNRFLSMISSRR